MKNEKTFTMRLGDFTTVAHEVEAPASHIQKIMDEMTADIYKTMYIGIDLGAGDMTSTTVIAASSELTIEDFYRAMDMIKKNSPPLKALEPKSEFKSWPYGID